MSRLNTNFTIVHQEAQPTRYTGLTSAQFDYLSSNYASQGFVSDRSRIDNYSNPMMNIADRNWQETLRRDSNYSWSQTDRESYRQNCAFGPHNAGPALDRILFK